MLVLIRPARKTRRRHLCAFVLMAALLNPVVPVSLSRVTSLLVLAMSLAALASWQAILRRTVHGPSVSQVLHS